MDFFHIHIYAGRTSAPDSNLKLQYRNARGSIILILIPAKAWKSPGQWGTPAGTFRHGGDGRNTYDPIPFPTSTSHRRNWTAGHVNSLRLTRHKYPSHPQSGFSKAYDLPELLITKLLEHAVDNVRKYFSEATVH